MTHALADRCLVVAGATGSVGGWIVAGALDRGATVVAVARSKEKLTALADRFDGDQRSRLHPVPCDLSSPDAAAAGRAEVARLGINAAVAALGRWWEGTPLLELPMASWHTVLAENLTAHFVAAQAFAPLLDDAADPCYLTMAGVAALKAVVSSGAVSVSGAAQQMLLRVLAAENARSALRFHQLLITTPVVSPDDAATRAEHADWILGPDVAAHVARILDHEFDRSVTEIQQPVPYVPRTR